MNVCNEMRKLRKWLDRHDIEWVDVSDDFGIDIRDIDTWICRTHFEVGGGTCIRYQWSWILWWFFNR